MSEILEAALEYAERGWRVFPLAGKVPAIAKAQQCVLKSCHGECAGDGHGLWDATTDATKIRQWWERYPVANIGARIPDGLLVVDLDPRNGASVDAFSYLPRTMKVLSGRGDGGSHRYFCHPGGSVSAKRCGDGVDIKTSSGYMVMPPSLHPETGKPYEWIDSSSPQSLPTVFVALLRPVRASQALRPSAPSRTSSATSPADWFCDSHTWTEVLGTLVRPAWTCVGGDGESDGSRWRHPSATAAQSATLRHDLLFCYSSSTALAVTEPGSPRGLTKFRVWAELTNRTLREAAIEVMRLRDRKVNR